jgi:hypothetical protein
MFHPFTQISKKNKESVTLEHDKEDCKNITRSVAYSVQYGCKWWICCVLSAEEEIDTVDIVFVHPNVPSVSYTGYIAGS